MSSARPMAFFDRESNYTGIDAEGGSPARKLTPAQRRRIRHKTAHVLGRGLHLYEKQPQPAQPAPLRLSADDILRQKVHIRLNEQASLITRSRRQRKIPAFLRTRGRGIQGTGR